LNCCMLVGINYAVVVLVTWWCLLCKLIIIKPNIELSFALPLCNCNAMLSMDDTDKAE